MELFSAECELPIFALLSVNANKVYPKSQVLELCACTLLSSFDGSELEKFYIKY